MGCQIKFSSLQNLYTIPTRKTSHLSSSSFSNQNQNQNRNRNLKRQSTARATLTETQPPKTNVYNIKFNTLGACKLGISRYPDFIYNAEGGKGTGTGTKTKNIDEIPVEFDVETLYIPPLMSSTTKFLGLPLPPFLRIDIVPNTFQGIIYQDSGKVDLEFSAEFLFSIGRIYKARPLVVKTVLTTDESKGKFRSGRGARIDEEGKCRLVGVATVEPINDFLMDSFLALPTECLADLNAQISFPLS